MHIFYLYYLLHIYTNIYIISKWTHLVLCVSVSQFNVEVPGVAIMRQTGRFFFCGHTSGKVSATRIVFKYFEYFHFVLLLIHCILKENMVHS